MTILKNSNSRYTALVWLTLIAVTLLGLSMAIISGCTDTLKGDADANRAPVVYFVNIPPDNTEFSYNPEVYWFGSDVDGQIVYYRYLVATISEADSAANYDEARAWAARQNDQVWTYVDIEPRAADPQTSRAIPLSADPDSAITTFVEQFVFIQAFDDDGAGSVIAVKCLSRNDHPPETEIYNSMKDDSPYVNSVTPGGSITGIAITWSGSDKADYDERGLVAPPFEYEWKLYGPYESSTMDSMLDIDSGANDSSGFGFVQYCWFTEDGDQYFAGDSLLINDSILVGEDEERHWEYWDTTIYFGPSVLTNNGLGIRRDLLITTIDTMFTNNLVAQSNDGYDSWVPDMEATVYDVYANTPATSVTITKHFIFTVRSRDDAFVPDPTPDFCHFPVIDPKHERDVLVLNFTSDNPVNYAAIKDKDETGVKYAKKLFMNLIESWDPNIDFDTTTSTGDFLSMIKPEQEATLTLEKAMRYKTMIWYSDFTGGVSCIDLMSAYKSGGNAHLLKALQSGVNVWATGRALFAATDSTAEVTSGTNVPAQVLTDYFGIGSLFLPGWKAYFTTFNDDPKISIRMEDFIGAYSIDESKWPNVEIDPDLLRDRYEWPTVPFGIDLPALPFDPDIAALPEVGWCGRVYGTEVMYLYKSLYGSEHFLGFPYNIEGAPCGHRLETDLYRTVYLGFPPFAMRQDQMQPLANSILDWLYEPWEDR